MALLDTLELNGTRTAYEVDGTGPPLLMLHGAEGTRRQFALIRPALVEHFTVITYDQRDCGDTVNPEQPATLSMLADDAKALLDALGHATAHVFGTSFGGRVAQALAVRHPDVIRRLVLGSTWPLQVSIAQANAEVAQALARLRSALPESAEQMAQYFYPSAYLQANPAARRHFASAPARSVRSERRAAATGDIPDLDIGRIAKPTLLIAGALDRVVPMALTLSLAQGISGSQSIVLPDVGHLAVTQAPDLMAHHLIDFLA
ncbi:alpha/beta hydrolase [Variovorax sp. J22P168]|uniref:alpha/beta fold hydrolase n=1 Tax=Variovorax jilinensis TaxID=3053513 RepID=UPI002574B174|nr:alpha/beta hydrolase [Variovorax sp. J22P168]MDM0015301.1 alpha/beta hydrolase [Variovorax sp. J22P168]